MISKIEQAQLDVLDTLIEAGGHWVAGDGRVLITLAQAIHDDESIDSHDLRYKRISVAVLRLEEHGLVAVDRRFHDEPEKANIIERIRLI